MTICAKTDYRPDGVPVRAQLIILYLDIVTLD